MENTLLIKNTEKGQKLYERAKEIIGRFNRKMDREEYFNYLDSIKEKGEEYVE